MRLEGFLRPYYNMEFLVYVTFLASLREEIGTLLLKPLHPVMDRCQDEKRPCAQHH